MSLFKCKTKHIQDWTCAFSVINHWIAHAMCEHADSYPGDCCLIEIDGFVLYLSTPDKPECNHKLCKTLAPALKSQNTM